MKNIMILSAALLAALGLFLSACTGNNAAGVAPDDSPVLTTVNGESITVDVFKSEAAALSPYALQALADDATRKTFLDNLVAKKLVVQEAKKEGYDSDPEVVRQINLVMDSLLFRTYVNKQVMEKAEVGDAELKEYFDNNKETLGSVRISHIQVGSREEAEDVLIKYKAGESFLSLAKSYSQDANTSKKGGDLGFLDWAEFGTAELRKAAFTTPLGEVSNVIKSSFAYHIIKITDRKPAGDADFDKIKEALKEDLLEKRREELFNSKIEALRNAADIRQNDEAFNSLSFMNLAKEPLRTAQ